MKSLRYLPLIAGILIALMLLSGCGTPATITETRIQIEKVPVRARCPDKATYDALVADQPAKLATRPMPATAQERVAQQSAQLGRYEARGGWVDRTRAVLDRCQQGEDLTDKP